MNQQIPKLQNIINEVNNSKNEYNTKLENMSVLQGMQYQLDIFKDMFKVLVDKVERLEKEVYKYEN